MEGTKMSMTPKQKKRHPQWKRVEQIANAIDWDIPIEEILDDLCFVISDVMSHEDNNKVEITYELFAAKLESIRSDMRTWLAWNARRVRQTSPDLN
jgi:hypothetical protein